MSKGKPFPCDKLGTGSNCAYRGIRVGGRGLVVDVRGVGVMQKREYPDFRFPEAGISALGTAVSVRVREMSVLSYKSQKGTKELKEVTNSS